MLIIETKKQKISKRFGKLYLNLGGKMKAFIFINFFLWGDVPSLEA